MVIEKALSITFFLLIAFFAIIAVIPAYAFADISSSSIATSAIVVSEIENLSVVCTYKNGNSACKDEYDPSMYGVINDNPSTAIVDTSLASGRLVITSGVTLVRVTNAGGDITEGDLLTSSKIPGVAQKATRNGYVLGVALENFSGSETGVIQMMVNIHPTTILSGQRGNILQFIRQGLAVPIFQPLESLRYLLAIIIIIIAFTLGMFYFGKTSRAGIEAIGRNPLAKNVIQLTVIMNIVLTIVIVLVGLGIAYMILIF
ncbi:MAG: hypothetical protein N2558_04300 [Patescibacteria group bacterium]|nr:hypothetical protein [Patescibacteria group bacterium]